MESGTKHGLTSSLMCAISATVMVRKAARGRKMESFILCGDDQVGDVKGKRGGRKSRWLLDERGENSPEINTALD